ncbi:MAG: alpha/beta fold hydrolase [Bacteroidota bacterium]
MTKPTLAVMLALLFGGWPQWSFGQIQQFDYLLDNSTLTPNFAGQTFRLHLREKVSEALLNDPNTDYSDKVVLMIHGNSVPATAVFDLDYQDYSWMDALAAEGYDVFALSLTGYGHSTRPTPMQDSCNVDFLDRLDNSISCLFANYRFRMTSSDSEMDDMDAAVEFIRSLRDVEDVHLIGHSLGGFRVMLYSSRYPEKVGKLITHGFSGVLSSAAAEPPPELPSDGYPMSVINRSDIEDLFDAAECFDQFDPEVVEPAWQACQSTDSLGLRWGETGGVVRHPQIDLYGLTNDTLASITQPTLVLIGEVDNIAPPIAAQSYYDRLGSSNKVYVEINRTSHIGYWESRKEALHQLCINWLNDSSIDGRSIGKAIYKLNQTFDWIGEIDEQNPPQITALSPPHQATFVDLNSDLVIELDENIFSLAEHLTIFRKADYSVFQYIEMDNTALVQQVCSNILQIDINELEADTEYFVYLHYDAFRDRSFNTFEGILTDKVWSFSTGELITSTTELTDRSTLNIFPNPTRDYIHIHSTSPSEILRIELLSPGGQVLQSHFFQAQGQLDVRAYPPGAYFLQCATPHSNHTQKIIIQ